PNTARAAPARPPPPTASTAPNALRTPASRTAGSAAAAEPVPVPVGPPAASPVPAGAAGRCLTTRDSQEPAASARESTLLRAVDDGFASIGGVGQQYGGGAAVVGPGNRRIIRGAPEDGRRSYAAHAKSVGLSEAAVGQRVQRLLGTGVMQVVAVTDPMIVGFDRQAMIGVRADGDLRQVAAELAALDEVDYVVVTAGRFDILVEVVCA